MGGGRRRFRAGKGQREGREGMQVSQKQGFEGKGVGQGEAFALKEGDPSNEAGNEMEFNAGDGDIA